MKLTIVGCHLHSTPCWYHLLCLLYTCFLWKTRILFSFILILPFSAEHWSLSVSRINTIDLKVEP
ncbi:uncharacterized protein C8R40DRAFT_887473 [Lentinula edodes]|uniref:uncharacterized protein n=1 Tax=Lentinula edodes TaxID=5353 RepID=UPI001E8C9E6A|nr:uncharacterized protein C8R40DRAFT_887473 [Lentinula edodes]KAH7867951.1 hypothetical protein C8R40DRAFT_887473 [Lentinula edodes]